MKHHVEHRTGQVRVEMQRVGRQLLLQHRQARAHAFRQRLLRFRPPLLQFGNQLHDRTHVVLDDLAFEIHDRLELGFGGVMAPYATPGGSLRFQWRRRGPVRD